VSEVAADMASIAALGLDHVRIFPLWPLLQPNRTMISASALADVATVVAVAADHGLSVFVDALNGHLSSFDFLPAWLTSWHRADLFTDPRAVAGQRELLRRLGALLADYANARGIGLGNEIAQFASPGHPHPARPSHAAVDDWLAGHFAVLEEVWPSGDHTHSFDDSLWFADDHPFLPRHAVSYGSETTVHSWVFTGAGQRYGARHPALGGFARYLLELARGWSHDAGRQVWLQEVGAPINVVAADDAPAFARETLCAVAGTPGLSRITWWCSHDVARSAADFPELEYSLGLFDADGRLKPVGCEIGALIPTLRTSVPDPERPDPLTVAIDAATGVGRSASGPGGELFDRWQADRARGIVRPVRIDAQ